MKIQHFDTTDLPRIQLQEFMDLANELVVTDEPQSLMQLAEPLYRLAQDKSLLQGYINFGINNWKENGTHFYSPQSCQLIAQGELAVRVNLWPLLPQDPRRRAILADVLSYFDCHDHNFSFITANYFGPGYETDMYNYQRDQIIGYPGEQVELEYLGRHRLDDQTVMLYEEFLDVHAQLPPETISSSINLMLVREDSSLTNQHYFDVEKGLITGYVGSVAHKRVNVLAFAERLHDDETFSLLYEIAEKHECSRTRVEAGRVLLSIEGERAMSAATRERMLRDPLSQALWTSLQAA